ncbi:MAG: hypothetical protein HND58_15380 [Planctomycetota bacterium]|nr:MAG: hypothetical protein HND58_15380 [Planctomycetota bacterium]
MKTSPERAGAAASSAAEPGGADEPPPQYSTIRVAESSIHGRGVFARRTIRKGEVVIVNPALPLGEGEVRDDDLIARYCFEWPKDGDGRALALGEASLLNHAPDAPRRRRGRRRGVFEPALAHRHPERSGDLHRVPHNRGGRGMSHRLW